MILARAAGGQSYRVFMKCLSHASASSSFENALSVCASYAARVTSPIPRCDAPRGTLPEERQPPGQVGRFR